MKRLRHLKHVIAACRGNQVLQALKFAPAHQEALHVSVVLAKQQRLIIIDDDALFAALQPSGVPQGLLRCF
jgi:hypothetical protein